MLEITLIVLAMLVNVVAVVVGVAVSRQWSRTALGIALLFVLAVNVAGVFGQIIKVRGVQAKEDAILARKDMLVKLLGDEISNASGIEYRLEERMTRRAMTPPALDAFVKEIEAWRKGVGERLDRLLPGTYAARIFFAARGEFPGAYLAVGGRTQVQVGLTPGFYQYTHVRECRSGLTAILASVDSFVRLSSDLKAPAVTERAHADVGTDARSLNRGASMAANVDWQMVSALATVVYTLGTFALWWVTQRSLRLARDGFKLSFLLAYLQLAHPPTEQRRPWMSGLEWIEIGRAPFVDLLRRVFPKDYESLLGRREPERPASESTSPK